MSPAVPTLRERDPMQVLWDCAAHEAAHACALMFYGRRVARIDIDRPESGLAGAVTRADRGRLLAPDHADPGAYAARHLARMRQEDAVALRMGALMARQPWGGPESMSDRRCVGALAPPGLSASAWGALVDGWAEKLAQDEGYRATVRALSTALLADRHRPMSGARAERVVAAAIREEA